MREILFKAKRLDNSEWVTGDLTQDRDLDQCFISGWDYYTDYSGLQREPFEYQVDIGTVCQYTGLTDRNGVKVFEGDKMVFDIYERQYSGFVEFVDGSFGVNCEVAQPFLDDAIKKHGAEVIGNIHDKED